MLSSMTKGEIVDEIVIDANMDFCERKSLSSYLVVVTIVPELALMLFIAST